MYNKSNKVYTVETVIGIRSTLYTGITKSVVKKDRRDVRVGPKTGIYSLHKQKLRFTFTAFLSLNTSFTENQSKVLIDLWV